MTERIWVGTQRVSDLVPGTLGGLIPGVFGHQFIVYEQSDGTAVLLESLSAPGQQLQVTVTTFANTPSATGTQRVQAALAARGEIVASTVVDTGISLAIRWRQMLDRTWDIFRGNRSVETLGDGSHIERGTADHGYGTITWNSGTTVSSALWGGNYAPAPHMVGPFAFFNATPGAREIIIPDTSDPSHPTLRLYDYYNGRLYDRTSAVPSDGWQTNVAGLFDGTTGTLASGVTVANDGKGSTVFTLSSSSGQPGGTIVVDNVTAGLQIKSGGRTTVAVDPGIRIAVADRDGRLGLSVLGLADPASAPLSVHLAGAINGRQLSATFAVDAKGNTSLHSMDSVGGAVPASQAFVLQAFTDAGLTLDDFLSSATVGATPGNAHAQNLDLLIDSLTAPTTNTAWKTVLANGPGEPGGLSGVAAKVDKALGATKPDFAHGSVVAVDANHGLYVTREGTFAISYDKVTNLYSIGQMVEYNGAFSYKDLGLYDPVTDKTKLTDNTAAAPKAEKDLDAALNDLFGGLGGAGDKGAGDKGIGDKGGGDKGGGDKSVGDKGGGDKGISDSGDKGAGDKGAGDKGSGGGHDAAASGDGSSGGGGHDAAGSGGSSDGGNGGGGHDAGAGGGSGGDGGASGGDGGGHDSGGGAGGGGSGAGGDSGGAPIVLDLNHQGIGLVALQDSHALFDFKGDGAREHAAWIRGYDGFLAYDPDHTGIIDRADQIAFVGYKPGAKTDLEGLTAFDTNHDGKLDQRDARWDDFGVWQNVAEDGVSKPGEFRTLDQLGIVSIELSEVGPPQAINGTTVNGLVRYTLADGSTGLGADVSLPTRPVQPSPSTGQGGASAVTTSNGAAAGSGLATGDGGTAPLASAPTTPMASADPSGGGNALIGARGEGASDASGRTASTPTSAGSTSSPKARGSAPDSGMAAQAPNGNAPADKIVLGLGGAADRERPLHVGADLALSVSAMGDAAMLAGWYAACPSRMSEIDLSDRSRLRGAGMGSLVAAMAQFDRPAGGETTLPPEIASEHKPVIAASWH